MRIDWYVEKPSDMTLTIVDDDLIEAFQDGGDAAVEDLVNDRIRDEFETFVSCDLTAAMMQAVIRVARSGASLE
jgi:hypothetical protein